jgi:ABC-type lipoprotein export system ATPase subunit
MGFREYFRKRDLTLLKTISLGVNREEYLILVGQRAELLNLLGKVDNADKIEIRKAEQLKAANKIKKPK